MRYFCLLLVSSLVLAACGGNGNKVDTVTSLNSSISITSSSSASDITGLSCNNEGAVFIDSVCSSWRNVSAYEQLDVYPWTGSEITNGSAGNAVVFKILDSQEAAHRQILDISYLPVSDYSGNVRILAPESQGVGVDMSSFATGSIKFDLKVISKGLMNADLEFTLDCNYPCISTPKIIKPETLNQWQTYEFSVAELIERGLNIKQVVTGFMLGPVWAKQASAHFQIDNVRWIKGPAATPTEKICYANYFDVVWRDRISGPGVTLQGRNMVVPLDQHIALTEGVNPYVKARPSWQVMGGQWTYSLAKELSYTTTPLIWSPTLSECSGAGVLSLELYTPAALVADGELKFVLHFADKNYQVYDIPGTQFSVANLQADEWNKISVNLSNATRHDDLLFVGLSVDASQVSPFLQAYFYVDNILIKQTSIP